MDRNAVCAALAPALLLYACDRTMTPADEAGTVPTPAADTSTPGPAAPAQQPSPAMVSPVSGADGVNDGYPDMTPPALTPEAGKGVKGARNVLLSFARALELREFDQAWALLSAGDKRKWSKPAFARMFADLETITVAIPGGAMEGAAGSLYYSSPVRLTGVDEDGRPVRIEGEAVLRRVNDVPGATAAQLRWHFDKLTLDWKH